MIKTRGRSSELKLKRLKGLKYLCGGTILVFLHNKFQKFIHSGVVIVNSRDRVQWVIFFFFYRGVGGLLPQKM